MAEAISAHGSRHGNGLSHVYVSYVCVRMPADRGPPRDGDVVRRGLTTKLKLVEEFAILLDVAVTDVIQHSTPAPDHHQQTTTTVVVFVMLLQVLGQAVDPFRQECNLHFRRTGIGPVVTVFRNDVFDPVV